MPAPPDPDKLAAALAFVRAYFPDCAVEHVSDPNELTVRLTTPTWQGAVRVPWGALAVADDVGALMTRACRRALKRMPGVWRR